MNGGRCTAVIRIIHGSHHVAVRCILPTSHEDTHQGNALPGELMWNDRWVRISYPLPESVTETPEHLRIIDP